jgi:enoyl-CoA hydratase
MVEDKTVLYEVRDGVAFLTLNRPDRRNAQNKILLDDLDQCWTRATDSPEVRVIVLRAEGKHFSAGHDMSDDCADEVDFDFKNVGMGNLYEFERVHYLGYSRKWRDCPKPSIAAVQGACIAAGLMLCWPCDLIVASDDAWFSDPVALMGIGGVEYHGHTWEFGARKAKELLFTASKIDAATAERLGMVNKIVPRAELDATTEELAQRIAQMPPFGVAMAKRAVNQTLDIMGQYSALQAVFDTHQLAHASAVAQTGWPVLAGLDQMRTDNKAKS